MDNKSMGYRNGKVVEEKVPLRRADTLKKNRWRKSGTEMTSAIEIIFRMDLGLTRYLRSPADAVRSLIKEIHTSPLKIHKLQQIRYVGTKELINLTQIKNQNTLFR